MGFKSAFKSLTDGFSTIENNSVYCAVRTDNLNVTQARIRPQTKEKMGQQSYNFHLLVSFNPKALPSFQPTVTTARKNGRHLDTFRGGKFCFSFRDNKCATSHCTPSCRFFFFIFTFTGEMEEIA